MGLSARERMLLQQLETQLHQEDPRLAGYLATGQRRWRMPSLRLSLLLVAVAILVGGVITTVGAVAGSPPVTVAGLLCSVVLPLAALLVAGWRR
jgi:hypothetical protein